MLARLLRATIEVLEQEGLAGTTIPRVASAAGVAPASVYRRFRDKNSLFRAAFLDSLERSVEANRGALRPELFRDSTLERVAGVLVAGIVRQYREHPGLLRALTRFVENDEDASFKKKALGYLADNIRETAKLLLSFRDQITHPDPKRAVIFGLLSVATVIEVNALDHVTLWAELLPVSDEEMQTELTQSFVSYLRSRTEIR
jgi:AcrR family transcriptional regulator